MKTGQVLKIAFLLIFTVTAFSPVAFSRQGTLTGQVIDGFDNVVKDVEVKIKKTGFTARTDENGQYRIDFVPGKIVLSFRKKGYTKQTFPLNIREASEIPMPKLTFWKLPESGGVFLVRVNDYKKFEYTSFYSERDDNCINFYVKGEPTKIECPKDAFENGSIEIMMLDYSKEEPVVVGKNLYSITDNNLMGSIVFKSGIWGLEHIEDKYSEVSSRMGVRYVRLKPGKYCYCIGQLTQKSRLGFGYYFEIVDPGSSDKEKS